MKNLILKPGSYELANGKQQTGGDLGRFILDWLVSKSLLATTDCCTYTLVGGGGGGGVTTNTLAFNPATRVLTSTVEGIASSITLPTTTANVTTSAVIMVGLTSYPIGTALTTVLAALANPVDLGYVASPTAGTITNNGGLGTSIPLATTVNAGLLSPANLTTLTGLSSAATTTQIPFGAVGSTFTSSPNFTWDNTTNELTVNGKLNLTGGLDPTYVQFVEHTAGGTPTGAGKGGIYISNGTDGQTQNHLIYKSSGGTLTDLLGSTADGNDKHIVRLNTTAGVSPTVLEIASPINGDTAKVMLTDGKIEFWSYTSSWVLNYTFTPTVVDGNLANVVRANATTGVSPTAGEVASPVNGDVAIVFLNNGTVEYWSHNGTAWSLAHTVTASSVPAATEAVAGIVELATAVETTTGTDNTRAVHPQGLKVELDKKQNLATLTTKGDLYVATASATTTRLPVGTNGQILKSDSSTATGLSWFSPTDTVVSYLEYNLFATDTTTVFKVGDYISISNPFQINQVITAGTGFSGITTQSVLSQPQGAWFNSGHQESSDFTPDNVKYGNNYYVALTPGTPNINVAQLQSNGVNSAPASGQQITFIVFNTDTVAATLTFDATWKDSSGAALGVVTLAAGEQKHITFEGYYGSPNTARLVDVATPLGDVIPTWNTAVSYLTGNLVAHEDRVYRANTAHTSSAFNANRANWDVIVPLKVGTPWAASTFYYTGEIVNAQTKGVYVSRIASGTSGASFDNVEASSGWEFAVQNAGYNTWDPSTYYFVGEQVTYMNKVLQQVTGQVSNATFDPLESGKWKVVQSDQVAWVANVFYFPDEIIRHNGIIYRKVSGSLSGGTFDSVEEALWNRVGEEANVKTITTATYTVGQNDGLLILDPTSNSIDVTFPATIAQGKKVIFTYKQHASNTITITAGAGTTVVDPTSFVEVGSYVCPGIANQHGSTTLFLAGTVWKFLG
jgi:hypothetical protein